MWPSERWASFLYNAANIALIVKLVVGAVSTVLIVWMGNVKETYLRKGLVATSNQAAEANDSAERAERDNLTLRSQVATLETGAADAKKAQTIAERSLLELRQRIADRTIRPEQRERMLAVLRTQQPRKVVVQSLLSGGREALQYALAIAAVFRDASWTVTEPDWRGAFEGPISGVFLVASPNMDSNGSTNFLTQVIIAGDLSPLPIATSLETRRGDGVLEIWVASK